MLEFSVTQGGLFKQSFESTLFLFCSLVLSLFFGLDILINILQLNCFQYGIDTSCWSEKSNRFLQRQTNKLDELLYRPDVKFCFCFGQILLISRCYVLLFRGMAISKYFTYTSETTFCAISLHFASSSHLIFHLYDNDFFQPSLQFALLPTLVFFTVPQISFRFI